MMRKLAIVLLPLAWAMTQPGPSHAQELGGIERLACEALLCLSSSTRPAECSPSLSHYFGIKPKELSDLIEARFNFLMMCPLGSWPADMLTLADAISRGAGRCTADELNMLLQYLGQREETLIYGTLPDFCSVYYGHGLTDLEAAKPVYVGVSALGGKWFEAKDAEQAKLSWEQYLEDIRDGRVPYGSSWGKARQANLYGN